MDANEFWDFMCHELFTAFPFVEIVFMPDAVVLCISISLSELPFFSAQTSH
jgi:hypothetical protein